jgi:hypothetical protein
MFDLISYGTEAYKSGFLQRRVRCEPDFRANPLGASSCAAVRAQSEHSLMA